MGINGSTELKEMSKYEVIGEKDMLNDSVQCLYKQLEDLRVRLVPVLKQPQSEESVGGAKVTPEEITPLASDLRRIRWTVEGISQIVADVFVRVQI